MFKTMYIHRLPHTAKRELCILLDQNNKWEELGGKHMEYDDRIIQELRRENSWGKSPSDELLALWSLQNHDVLELFVLLSRMKLYQAMRTIEKFIDPEFHWLIEDTVTEGEDSSSSSGDSSRRESVNSGHPERREVDDEMIANVNHMPPPQELNNEDQINCETSPPIIKPKSPLPLESLVTTASLTTVVESAGAIPQIPYEELQESTNNWDANTELGKGGYATVFKGTWKYTKFAIKRIESKEGNPESFQEQIKQSVTELHCLNAYRHDNILPLYGYSINGPQPCLVYQYISGGSLDERLRIRDPKKVLNWNSRLNIAIGTARGLQYLHTLSEKPLIHGDIKSANILLDLNDNPRIGDFGLAKEGPQRNYTYITLGRIYGTRPYLPDEFILEHQLSTKVDTYSFGVVLFEVATSLFAYAPNRQHKLLKEHVISYEGDVRDLMDRRVENCTEIYKVLINVGKHCVQNRPEDRPEMVNVLISLESVSVDFV